MIDAVVRLDNVVYCHIGSLENLIASPGNAKMVYCHIGSLEILKRTPL